MAVLTGTEFECQHAGRFHAQRTYEKATAESAVQVVERWLMARLRHTVLADVHAADAALAALLPSLNERRF